MFLGKKEKEREMSRANRRHSDRFSGLHTIGTLKGATHLSSFTLGPSLLRREKKSGAEDATVSIKSGGRVATAVFHLSYWGDGP